MEDHITADLRFSIVPEWVLDADLSDRAIRIYSLIARYADNDTLQAFPSRDTLARRARCHVKSVDRAIKELVEAGALDKKHRKHDDAHYSNLYTVRRIPPRGWSPVTRVGTQVSPGGDTAVPRVGTPQSLGRDTTVPLTITTEEEPVEQKPNNYMGAQFEEFWSIYPKKADKPKARRAFEAALKRASFAEILEGAKRYRDDPNRDDAYTKNPQGWLTADAWENPPIQAPMTRLERIMANNEKVFAKYRTDFGVSLKSPDDV